LLSVESFYCLIIGVALGLISGEEGNRRIKESSAQAAAKKEKEKKDIEAEQKKDKKKSKKRKKQEVEEEEEDFNEPVPPEVEEEWSKKQQQLRTRSKKPKTKKEPAYYKTAQEALKRLDVFASKGFIYVDPKKVQNPPRSISARGLYEIQIQSLFHYYWAQGPYLPAPHPWIIVQANVCTSFEVRLMIFL
jgi:outer membrane biosynthesis protein TonB